MYYFSAVYVHVDDEITCEVNLHDVMCCDGSQKLMFKKILNDSLMIAEPNVN